jgi:DNA-directed RNA polymerase specialized sigma24 family protein
MSFTSLLPPDATPEEVIFLEIVKKRMLQKLENDRTRFVFVYVIEQGRKQRDCAEVLGVHETEIARQMRYIRERLQEYKKGY